MKSWPELTGSGNPEAHDYGAGPQTRTHDKDIPGFLVGELNFPHLTLPIIMVERVTVALAQSYYKGQPSLQHMARAAIAAMREPTNDMLLKGSDELGKPKKSLTQCWRDMIDAALKE